ncbi:MAG: flavin reductase family protein [Candidatus Hermodarchaeota archaeon]
MQNRIDIEPFDRIDSFNRNTALMVTMDKTGKCNVMALDWKKITEFKGDPVIRAQVAYSRYTYALLTEGIDEFTINIPSDRNYNAVSIAGSRSGRNTDKIKMANLEIIPGKSTKVPTLKDCILSYECKIIHNEKSEISSHHYFYGKILNAYASDD